MLDSFQNQIDLSPSRDGLGYFRRPPASLHLYYTIFQNSNCQLFVNSRADMSIMSRVDYDRGYSANGFQSRSSRL